MGNACDVFLNKLVKNGPDDTFWIPASRFTFYLFSFLIYFASLLLQFGFSLPDFSKAPLYPPFFPFKSPSSFLRPVGGILVFSFHFSGGKWQLTQHESKAASKGAAVSSAWMKILFFFCLKFASKMSKNASWLIPDGTWIPSDVNNRIITQDSPVLFFSPKTLTIILSQWNRTVLRPDYHHYSL